MAATSGHMCRSLQAKCHRLFSTQVLSGRQVRVGDTLPDVTVYEKTPGNPVKIHDLFRGTKGILFSVLGAFNPGCSVAHVPEYLSTYDQFEKEGYTVLACMSVNDPFVMEAWGKMVDREGKIRMLADPVRDLTKALDMELNCKPLLGNIRAKRFSMLIEDNKVKHISMEPDATGLACLLCIQRHSSKSKQAKKKRGSSNQ